MKGIENWNSAHHRRISRICIGLVILMLAAYTLVCYIVIDKYSVIPGEALAGEVNHISPVIATDKAILPVPDAGSSVDWECGTYYSNISEIGMKGFLSSLSKAGWKDMQGGEIASEVKPGTACYDLVNGDHVLQLMTFLTDAEHAVFNSILVYYNEDCSYSDLMNRKDTVSKEEAMQLIQAQVDGMSGQGVIPDTRKVVTGLFEIPVKNAYERMQVQAFAAISDMGVTGCFLLRGGNVSYIPGSLANAQVADIDGDGSYELLNMSETWEANTYRLELTAYEYRDSSPSGSLSSVPVEKYLTRYVPKNGYEQFALVKDEKENVLLTGDAGIYGTVHVVDGALCIQGEKTPELISWANSFDQSKLQLINKTVPDHPPDITISIGNTTVDYVTQMTNWNGTVENDTPAQIIDKIGEKHKKIPTVTVDSFVEEENQQRVSIDFGDCMPDSIQVYDALLEDNGGIRYNMNSEQAVQIMSDSRVEFPLIQHMAYYLSSNSGDYERDWKRLFRVTCTWGKKQCTYAFIINTSDRSDF